MATGQAQGRLFELVEKAHPGRIERHADEWERCAAILEQAAAAVEGAAARHGEIGGQTGPAMARAFVLASGVLREKSDDLRRGGAALRYVADATRANKEEKNRIDRDHPDDGTAGTFIVREDGAGRAADAQEASLRHGIKVMKSIREGRDPRSTGIPVDPPPNVVVRTPSWYPVQKPPPTYPTGIGPDDPDWDDPDDFDPTGTPQGPTGSVTTTGGGATPGVIGSGGLSGGGAAALGVGAVVAGGTGAAARAVASSASAARPIGAGGSSGSASTLGRGAAPVGVGGTPAGARGGSVGGAAAGGAGGRGAGTGGVLGGGGGRRSGRDREQGRDRDLHDDGQDWLDDEASPDVLR